MLISPILFLEKTKNESVPVILSLYFSLQNMTLSSSLKAWLGSNQPLTSLHALGTQQHNENISNK
jgi:hypothetical protein